MTEHGLELYRGTRWVSPSSLCCFKRCRRRFFYQKCGLCSVDEHPALSFGRAIHAALPWAYQVDGLVQAKAAFKSVWTEDIPGEVKRSTARAFGMLENFAENHRGDRALYRLVRPPEGTPGESPWEVPFVVDVGAGIPLVGRLDGIGEHRDTGEPWGVEFKTTSQLGSMFLESFQNNPQVLIYTLALRAVLGQPVRGVFVEGLLVATKSYNNEAIPVWVHDWWLEDTLRWVRDTIGQIRACEDRGFWPKDPTGCVTMGMFGMPGFPCEFAPLCAVEDWTTVRSLYGVREEVLPPGLKGEV